MAVGPVPSVVVRPTPSVSGGDKPPPPTSPPVLPLTFADVKEALQGIGCGCGGFTPGAPCPSILKQFEVGLAKNNEKLVEAGLKKLIDHLEKYADQAGTNIALDAFSKAVNVLKVLLDHFHPPMESLTPQAQGIVDALKARIEGLIQQRDAWVLASGPSSLQETVAPPLQPPLPEPVVQQVSPAPAPVVVVPLETAPPLPHPAARSAPQVDSPPQAKPAVHDVPAQPPVPSKAGPDSQDPKPVFQLQQKPEPGAEKPSPQPVALGDATPRPTPKEGTLPLPTLAKAAPPAQSGATLPSPQPSVLPPSVGTLPTSAPVLPSQPAPVGTQPFVGLPSMPPTTGPLVLAQLAQMPQPLSMMSPTVQSPTPTGPVVTVPAGSSFLQVFSAEIPKPISQPIEHQVPQVLVGQLTALKSEIPPQLPVVLAQIETQPQGAVVVQQVSQAVSQQPALAPLVSQVLLSLSPIVLPAQVQALATFVSQGLPVVQPQVIENPVVAQTLAQAVVAVVTHAPESMPALVRIFSGGEKGVEVASAVVGQVAARAAVQVAEVVTVMDVVGQAHPMLVQPLSTTLAAAVRQSERVVTSVVQAVLNPAKNEGDQAVREVKVLSLVADKAPTALGPVASVLSLVQSVQPALAMPVMMAAVALVRQTPQTGIQSLSGLRQPNLMGVGFAQQPIALLQPLMTLLEEFFKTDPQLAKTLIHLLGLLAKQDPQLLADTVRLLTGILEKAPEALASVIQTLAKVAELAPQVLRAVVSLLDGVLQTQPKLLLAVSDLLGQIVQKSPAQLAAVVQALSAVLEQSPQILQLVVQLFNQVASSPQQLSALAVLVEKLAQNPQVLQAFSEAVLQVAKQNPSRLAGLLVFGDHLEPGLSEGMVELIGQLMAEDQDPRKLKRAKSQTNTATPSAQPSDRPDNSESLVRFFDALAQMGWRTEAWKDLVIHRNKQKTGMLFP